MIKISVIIPIYKVEKYLRRCLDSVLNQTYSNIEVILVDDGSPDNCPQICDEYAHKDNRIVVIHKENGGLSSARNAGLNYPPSGDYVTFLDSDDWLELDTYQFCVCRLEQLGADAIQFSKILTSKEMDIIEQPHEILKEYIEKDILQFYMYSTTHKGGYSVCSCLFPNKNISDLRFREGKINEDIDFKYRILSRCHKLLVSNQIKYHYWQPEEGSLSSGGLKKKDYDLYDAAEELLKLTKDESFGTIAELVIIKRARVPLSLLSKIAYYGISDATLEKKKVIKQLKREVRSSLWTLLKSPIPMSRKILAIMFSLNYKTTEVAIHLLRKQ